MVFRSKVDAFFVNVMVIVVLVIASVTIFPLFLEEFRDDLAGSIILILVFLLVIGFLLWTCFSVQYIFHQDHLFIKGGPFKSRIPYEKIIKVAPTKAIFTGHRILSSRDAIEITNQTTVFGSIKISPKNKEAFISELKKRNPAIRIEE